MTRRHRYWNRYSIYRRSQQNEFPNRPASQRDYDQLALFLNRNDHLGTTTYGVMPARIYSATTNER